MGFLVVEYLWFHVSKFMSIRVVSRGLFFHGNFGGSGEEVKEATWRWTLVVARMILGNDAEVANRDVEAVVFYASSTASTFIL